MYGCNKFILLFLWIGLWSLDAAAGPFAPAAGQPNSTAIPMPVDPNDDSVFVGWADGWCDYILGTNVDVQWQTPEKALGPAKGIYYDIVFLGRGGQITLTFSTPIANGPGWDFAVFENSQNDTFLELGYVEVSSDGVNFVRFDNYSQTESLVGAFGTVDPTNITGYCSKYRQGYGTPFDLNDLAGRSGLDITAVTHVRIVDIPGDGSCLDTEGKPIYDPYPCTGSAGVDLEAIGVLNQRTLQADYDGNGIVNLEDFAMLATAYLNDNIGLEDLLSLSEEWLQTERWYQFPEES